MNNRDTGAEQLIKETAKRIFFAEGKFNATTQDIADAAGVTRTLVNYYFRSKDILFKEVYKEAMGEVKNRLDEVLASDLPLKKKIENAIDVFYADLMAFPYKESFLIQEINLHGFDSSEKSSSPEISNFLNEVQEAINKGLIKQMKPTNFMMNLFSLMAYPFLTRPLFTRLFETSETEFDTLLLERKKMIMDVLFP